MKKKIGIIISVIVIVSIGVGCFLFFKDDNRLTSAEREWLNESTKKVQNIHIVNDENLFGKNGKGLFYRFVDDFEEKYRITLNNITYKSDETVSGALFGVSNVMPEGSLEFYKDHYVYVGKDRKVIRDINDLDLSRMGVLSSNNTYLSKYFKNINCKTYSSKDELLSALDNGEVLGIMVPRIEYLDVILEKNYVINYHLSDVPYYYYMSDIESSSLKSVMKKFFLKWKKDKLNEYMALEENGEFTKDLKIEEKDLVDMQSRDVSYGLVNNSPYEVLLSGQVGGIVTDYLKAFSNFSGIDIAYSRYSNFKKLSKKINSNDVSLYMNYYDISSNSNAIPTNINIDYQVFVYEDSDLVINSLDSLKDKTVYVEENTILLSLLSKNSNLNIKTYNREKEWKKITKKKDSIIIIDASLGDYHSKGDLRKFKKIYEEKSDSTYSLGSLNNDNFNKLLTNYINYLDNNTIKQTGFYHNKLTEKQGNVVSTIAQYSFYFIVVIGIILLLIFHNTKKVRIAKKIKKDDKLKYIDQLTSLKNRNYLNENIEAWNKNTIYPQCVIMLDLNRLQEINDTLGYEEGDKQIQGVANILIRSQLDNTDIIRTDGTEFMIYTVGYNQKQITSYIHKLNKEFKNLPYEYGIYIAYSMILDDLKDISDAINECVEDIKNQKNVQKEDK